MAALIEAFPALKITLFIPCFVDQLFPAVGISAVRIFEKLGHTVDFKEAIFCCGQPSFNGGYWEETREIAARVLQALAGTDPVVVPSGSLRCDGQKFFTLSFFAKRCRPRPQSN